MMPRRVRVTPHTYTIKLDRSGTLAAAELHGHTRHADLVIELTSTDKKSMRRDTLLHEVLHAVLNPLHLGEDEEERIIRFLSPRLLALIVDNPKLIAYLVDE